MRNPALQRVRLNIRVRPLTAAEVRAYVGARLELTGAGSAPIFTTDALERVAAKRVVSGR